MTTPKPDPFFVFGALRSGTTLLRLILTHHPRIHSVGEADYLFDYILPDPDGPGGWRYDHAGLEADWVVELESVDVPKGPQGVDMTHALMTLDPLPHPDALLSFNIHRNAPTMMALFPDAKVIHLLRDPRDVARSSVGMGWYGNSYTGVSHWIDTEAGWDALSLPEDQVLTIRFEDLMADLETNLTRICDFLGLTFEPEMLEYHKSSSYGPPNPGIAQQWRKKAGAREVARIDGRAGGLMVSRGYELAGDPVVPGAAEKLYLRFENTLKRWRFNIRRYGFALFAASHAARVPGASKLKEHFEAKKRTIDMANLQ